jgi:hypothetical protein
MRERTVRAASVGDPDESRSNYPIQKDSNDKKDVNAHADTWKVPVWLGKEQAHRALANLRARHFQRFFHRQPGCTAHLA